MYVQGPCVSQMHLFFKCSAIWWADTPAAILPSHRVRTFEQNLSQPTYSTIELYDSTGTLLCFTVWWVVLQLAAQLTYGQPEREQKLDKIQRGVAPPPCTSSVQGRLRICLRGTEAVLLRIAGTGSTHCHLAYLFVPPL